MKITDNYWYDFVYGNGVFVGCSNSSDGYIAVYNSPNARLSTISLLGLIYPIGSIYTSMVNVSPAYVLGFGDWTQIKNRFLYCTTSSGTTGGSSTHSHEYGLRHTANACNAGNLGSNTGYSIQTWDGVNNGWHNGTHVGETTGPETGGSVNGIWIIENRTNTSNNSSLPPYITCYAWYRSG